MSGRVNGGLYENKQKPIVLKDAKLEICDFVYLLIST